ncbi:hypothetical protein B0H12DRAFT_1328948 [Mycena haematopus]|nr:hypothetical protein B0H12DRAFT_1328948 [Mycena haematopus]
MKKAKAGHNGLGYQHIDTITVTNHPPYKDRGAIAASAKAQWVLTDLVNMATFLESHVAGDGNKYKAPVIRSLTEHLNDRIVRGGLKKADGVRQKLADIMVIYRGVTYLKTRSGGSWDDELGANVVTETEAEVWDVLILSRVECTPFRNRGWPPYPFFERLDPAKPKGDHSFRPRLGVAGNDVVLPLQEQSATNSGRYSPDWDIPESQFTQPSSEDQPDANSSQFDASSSQFDANSSQSDPNDSQLVVTNSSSSQSHSSIPSTPSTISRKRPAAPSTAADASSKKKARAGPNDALLSVSQALNTFGENMKTATRELTDVLRTSNTNSSPERRGRALELARKETWLALTDRIRGLTRAQIVGLRSTRV